MWRGEAYADLLRRQTEEEFHDRQGQGSDSNHFNVLGESANINLRTTNSNSQQLNMDGVSSFPNTMQHVQGPNNVLFASQMGQQPRPSNFGLQVCENNYGVASNELGEAVFMRSMGMLNNHVYTNGLFTPGEIFCNEGDRGMKRNLGEEDYNPYLPVTKQHITDERMAARMDNLYITADDHNYCSTSIFNPGALHTEFNSTVTVPGDEMLATKESIEDSCATEQANGKMRRDYPVFQFSAPLEQFLKRQNDILPSKIIDEICKPCLAVVPWAPPLHTDSEDDLSKENDKNKVIKENTDILTQEIETVEEVVM